jgi:uncharacterized cupin superfamily protein
MELFSMSREKPIKATNISAHKTKSLYPEPFASMMNGRTKRKLGDFFGLTNFGINLTELSPGAMSALKHHHSKQDEFIYILRGSPTLVYGNDEYLMSPGECFGFRKGNKIGHHLVNHSDSSVVYLEMGDRTAEDMVEYPGNDLIAKSDNKGTWIFLHKDGSAY